MIVKVQTSLETNGAPAALLYDESRSFTLEVPVEQVEEIMRGRPKAFFHARLVDTNLQLGDEAPWQDW